MSTAASSSKNRLKPRWRDKPPQWTLPAELQPRNEMVVLLSKIKEFSKFYVNNIIVIIIDMLTILCQEEKDEQMAGATRRCEFWAGQTELDFDLPREFYKRSGMRSNMTDRSHRLVPFLQKLPNNKNAAFLLTTDLKSAGIIVPDTIPNNQRFYFVGCMGVWCRQNIHWGVPRSLINISENMVYYYCAMECQQCWPETYKNKDGVDVKRARCDQSHCSNFVEVPAAVWTAEKHYGGGYVCDYDCTYRCG